MMFMFRGFAVSLTIFALLYSRLSAAVAIGWPLLRLRRINEGSK
jgi:hypothetical protein